MGRLLSTLLIIALAVVAVVRPAGATTKVTHKGCKITITLKIEIFGRGANKDIAKKIKTDINDCFPKNHKFNGWCPVKMKTVVVVRKGTKPRKGFDHIEIVPDPAGDDVGGTFISHCDNVGTPDGKTETGGAWDDNEAKNTYAHEAGHLMGLEDQYDEGHDANGKRRTTPRPGHEQDKMATLSGMMQDSGIDTIIMKAGVKCPANCCRGRTPPTTTSSSTTTSTTLPSPTGPVCDGTFTAVVGFSNEANFLFSCQETTPITADGFAIQVPNRQVTNFIAPPGFQCQPITITQPNDALGCDGNVPPNQPVSGGRIQTSPPPQGPLGGQLFLYQGTTPIGPFGLSGP